jgi:hypothetical protein
MLFPARYLLPAAACALLAACGARSTLQDSDAPGEGGAGGATTSTSPSTGSGATSSSSTGTGAGGTVVACDSLAPDGPPITTVGPPGENGSRPRLVPASEDGQLAAVVLARQSLEGPAFPPVRIAHAAFEPWGAWPASLGQEYQVCSFGGDVLAVAPAVPAAQPGFATLFYLPTNAFPSDMYLAPAAEVKTTYDPYPQGVSWDAWEPAWPVALARGGAGHLAASQYLPGGPVSAAYLDLALIDAPGLGVTPIQAVACADVPFSADAVPVKDGFLLATAAGRNFGACLNDDGIPGPPDEVQVIHVDHDTGNLLLAATFEEPDPVAHVALARSAEGAWLVWQNNGQSAFQPPAIQAVRLDEAGAPAGPVFPAVAEGLTSGPFTAAALGPYLAVAWVEYASAGSPTLHIDVRDEKGAFMTEVSISAGAPSLYDPSLSLLASPDGAHLLLAWSTVDGPGAPAVPKVARFSCAAGL